MGMPASFMLSPNGSSNGITPSPSEQGEFGGGGNLNEKPCERGGSSGGSGPDVLPPILALRLLNYYRALPQALELLSDLVEVPSVSDTSKAVQGAPFGPEVRRVLDIAISAAERMGFRTYVEPEGFFGFAELGEGDEVILIVPHLDVVPGGNPEFWGEGGPYRLVVREDGTMIGRGVQDDKGPSVSILYAMAQLIDVPLLKGRRVRILFSLSEETGNKKGIEIYKQKFGEPFIALVPDGDFPASFEQGLVRVKLSGMGGPMLVTEDNSTNPVEILSISTGDNRANQVPAEVEVVFSLHDFQLLKDLERVLRDRLGDRYRFLVHNTDATGKHCLRIKVMGKAAHASQPWEGENAIQRLAEALEGVKLFDNPPARAIRFIQTAIGYDWSGEKLGIAGGEPEKVGIQTLNIGTLIADSNGVHEFVIDSRVRLDLEMDKVRDVLANIAKHAGFFIEEQRYVPPLVLSTDSPELTLLRSIYERTTGEKAAVRVTGVRTDAISFAGARLLSVCYGNVPHGVRRTFHEKPESNLVDSFVLGGEVYLRVGFELLVDKAAAMSGGIWPRDAIRDVLEELDLAAKQYKLNMQRIGAIKRALAP